jgi:hypothetical protein
LGSRLLSRSDTTVFVEVLLVAAVLGVAIGIYWRDQEWRSVGVSLCRLAFFAIRALH